MKSYQEIIGYTGVAIAVVCWIVVMASQSENVGGINIQWVGYMTSLGCLLFILISNRIDK